MTESDRNPNLDYIKPTRNTGEETFSNTNGQDFNVLEFWQWSASDLMSNATRGILAEYIVAKALGIDTRTTVRDEWAVWDLTLAHDPDDIKIEVKSSAYLQAWRQDKYYTPSFGIAPAVGWDGKSGESEDGPPRRHADVYVFCLYKYKGTKPPNPLDLDQWEFYVVPTWKLDEAFSNAKSIGLTSLHSLADDVLTWDQLPDALHNAELSPPVAESATLPTDEFVLTDFDTKQVEGRASIADLYPQKKRTGIYILHFADGAKYIGKASDVTRRFVQHKQNHGDIQQLSFKRVPKSQLDDIEKTMIFSFERQGSQLRNIALTSIPKGESDFDLIMSTNEQRTWLKDLGKNDFSGERIIDDNLRYKYSRKFKQLLTDPDSDGVIDFLKLYVASCIPIPIKSEVSFWGISCLPSHGGGGKLLSRVNVNWQEVANIFRIDDEIFCNIYCSVSVLEAQYGKDLSQLFDEHGTLEEIDNFYYPGGSDQIGLSIAGLENGRLLLSDPAVQSAIRLFNLRLMKKGPCAFGRHHCLDLADRILS